MLAAAGHQLGPPPRAEPTSPPPTPLAELAWLATKGTAWVLRRSTDLVPSLLAMALAEWIRPGPDPADLAAPDVAWLGELPPALDRPDDRPATAQGAGGGVVQPAQGGFPRK